MKTLFECGKNDVCKIIAINHEVEERLFALGFLCGEKIEVIERRNSCILVLIKNAKFVLDNEMASLILVKDL